MIYVSSTEDFKSYVTDKLNSFVIQVYSMFVVSLIRVVKDLTNGTRRLSQLNGSKVPTYKTFVSKHIGSF